MNENLFLSQEDRHSEESPLIYKWAKPVTALKAKRDADGFIAPWAMFRPLGDRGCSVQCLERMRYEGKKVCVLNFASATNPGGGVTKGSSAQEEAICRCSTLFPTLNEQEMWNAFYAPHRRQHDPLHNDDCIYTPGVMVFKSDTDYPRLLPEEKWYSVNVVTCVAPNLREKPSNGMNSGDGEDAVHISTAIAKSLGRKLI